MKSEEGLFVNHPNSPSWLSNMPQHTKDVGISDGLLVDMSSLSHAAKVGHFLRRHGGTDLFNMLPHEFAGGINGEGTSQCSEFSWQRSLHRSGASLP